MLTLVTVNIMFIESRLQNHVSPPHGFIKPFYPSLPERIGRLLRQTHLHNDLTNLLESSSISVLGIGLKSKLVCLFLSIARIVYHGRGTEDKKERTAYYWT